MSVSYFNEPLHKKYLHSHRHPEPCLKCDGDQWLVLSITEHPSWKTITYQHQKSSLGQRMIVNHVVAYWPDSISQETSNLIFQWRLNHPYSNVIKTLQCYEVGKNYPCGLKVNVNSVLIESIIPLSQISLSNYQQEQLFDFFYELALHWIKGFSQLGKIFDSFQIHQDMLGCDQKGQGKVWINKNYALNTIQTSTVYSGMFHQKYVVKRIFQIINEKIRHRGVMIKFYERGFEQSIQNLKIIMASRKQPKVTKISESYLAMREAPKICFNFCKSNDIEGFVGESTNHEKTLAASSSACPQQMQYGENLRLENKISSKIYSDDEEIERIQFTQVESELQLQEQTGLQQFYIIEESIIIKGN